MLQAGDVLELTPLDTTFTVTRTAAETDGESFEMEWRVGPRTGGTPVHVHPHATETYEVVDGKLDICIDGTWQTLAAGEQASVAAGVPHTFRNSHDEPATVRNAHEPAMRYDEYFAGLHRLVTRGIITSPRMGPKQIMHLALLMTSYPEEIRSVKPPHVVLRVFAALGTALRYRV